MPISTITVSGLGATGTPSSSTYLRGDNSWAAIASSQWTTTGSNIYYNTGNVGIGTASPSNKLHVYIPGDGTTPVKFETGNANGILNFYNDSNGWSLDSGGDFRVVTSRSNSGSPTRFYIDGSGNTLFSAARSSARALVDIPTSGGSAGVPLAVSRGGDGVGERGGAGGVLPLVHGSKLIDPRSTRAPCMGRAPRRICCRR